MMPARPAEDVKNIKRETGKKKTPSHMVAHEGLVAVFVVLGHHVRVDSMTGRLSCGGCVLFLEQDGTCRRSKSMEYLAGRV